MRDLFPPSFHYNEAAETKARPSLDFSALVRFPDIFSLSAAEQENYFKNVYVLIEQFLQQNENILIKNRLLPVDEQITLTAQQKFSRKNSLHNISSSLFCLSTGKQFRFFLVPNKNSVKAAVGATAMPDDQSAKTPNILGKGDWGTVIPAYELSEANGWRFRGETQPTLALKIYTSQQNDYYSKLLEVQKEMLIWKTLYPEECSFQEPLIRAPSKNSYNAPSKNSYNFFITYKFYLPMPYFPGIDGHRLWEDKSRFSLANFLEALRYCISALDEIIRLHGENILHCDIKPSNFKLYQGKAKLLDCGFSRKGSTEQKDDYSPFYAPWRTLATRCWSFEDEKYAAGLTLYEFLNGKDLFAASCGNKEFVEKLKARSPRIDQNFLNSIDIDSHLKQLLTAQITALVDGDPDSRPALSSVRDVFAQVLETLESQLKQTAAPQISEPELYDSRLVSTPSPLL